MYPPLVANASFPSTSVQKSVKFLILFAFRFNRGREKRMVEVS